MALTRTLAPHEFHKIQTFYAENHYTQPLSTRDIFLVLEHDGEIIAALRVCRESGCIVLRGMRVSPAFQRQGSGSLLLDYFAEVTGNKTCYCIAHRYLRDFYRQVGFEGIKNEHAPAFLVSRLTSYRSELGLDVILLYKAPTNNQPNK